MDRIYRELQRRLAIVGVAAALLSPLGTAGCTQKQAEEPSGGGTVSQAQGGPPAGQLHTYTTAIPSGNGQSAPVGSAMPPGGPKIPGRQ